MAAGARTARLASHHGTTNRLGGPFRAVLMTLLRFASPGRRVYGLGVRG